MSLLDFTGTMKRHFIAFLDAAAPALQSFIAVTVAS